MIKLVTVHSDWTAYQQAVRDMYVAPAKEGRARPMAGPRPVWRSVNSAAIRVTVQSKQETTDAKVHFS